MSIMSTRSAKWLTTLQGVRLSPRSLRSFRRAESGIASVEFALLSTVLLMMFAGGFDVAYMVGAKRDADRASMLIAHAMATCSSSSCMSEFINTYLPRKSNALIRYPSAAIELYLIQNQSSTIKSCSGTSTTLTDSKIIASATSLLRTDDVGSAVILTTSYTSMLPNMVLGYIKSAGETYSGRTVDVMGNVGAVC